MTIECPKCQFDNPNDTAFCGKCGTNFDIGKGPTKTLETPTEELTRGSVFAGRYEIIEELGKGGMGRVYRVEDKKIKQEIALKLIKPEIASDKKTIERFKNELTTARNIAHRNVCRMFDLGEGKGQHFITMEYVSGGDLKKFIRRAKRLDTGTAISIAKQICEGLEEAHSLGIVHRDLKPNNIMIDDNGNARIMDFGIARIVKDKGITGSGIMIGTPEYMSPEQAEAKEVDQRSDIYSLGVIMYEMTTGRLPFEGETPLAIAMKQKGETVKNPKEFNPQIPDDLGTVILKCLEKGRENRYQSAAEVRTELEKIEQGLPTTDRVAPKKKPITSREITVQFSLRKVLIPTLVVIIAVIMGLIIWSPREKKESASILADKPSLAVMYFKNNTGDQGFDIWRSAISDSIITDLSKSKFIRVLSSDRQYSILRKLNLLDAMSYTSEDLKKVAIEGGVNHILQGSLSKAGDIYRIEYALQNMIKEEMIESDRVEGRGLESLFSMVDRLSIKIKENFNRSEKEIAGDIDAGKANFLKGALVYTGMDDKLVPPRRIKAVDPVYPLDALEKRVEGVVLLNIRVNEQGNIAAIQILRSIPLLDQAAIDAVKQWRYEPMIINGKAIPVILSVHAKFKLR